MVARWASFAVGLGLMLAPLVVGYGSAGAILHDVALGLLACIAAVVALEWSPARFSLALPAVWLIATGRERGDASSAIPALAAGAALLVLSAIPGRRAPGPVSPLPRTGAPPEGSR